MVRGIANSKIGFGDLILLLRYFFKLKVSTHPNLIEKNIFLTLPKRHGVLFGVGLPKMVYTSPYQAKKNLNAVKTNDQMQDSEETDLNDIDFGKL